MESTAPDDRPLADAPWLIAPASRSLLAVLTAAGHEARFVGGCVRDALLDPALDVADLDLATQEPAPELLARLTGLGLTVLPTGLDHGTVTVRLGQRSFEVTTLRSDLATDGRHATVAWHGDFALDAARRDLTINALSCDGDGRVHDYATGRADLAEGRIRFMGEPCQRIREDYLRILRFFRFHARYGRVPPDPLALEACRGEAAGIDRLSGERIRVELLKLLAAPGALDSLRLMAETGVLAHTLPAPVAIERLAGLVHTAPDADPLLRLAALLRTAGAAKIDGLAARLVLSTRDRERLVGLSLLPFPDPSEPAQEAYRLGLERWRDLTALASAGEEPAVLRARLSRLDGWTRPVFPLAGDDLLARGIRQGPELGRLLAELHAWWQQDGLSADRTTCLTRLERLIADRHPR